MLLNAVETHTRARSGQRSYVNVAEMASGAWPSTQSGWFASTSTLGEPLRIRRKNIQTLVRGISSHWSLIFFPEERPDRGKIDLAHDKVEVACQWCSDSRGSGDDFCHHFTYPQFLTVLRRINKRLELSRHRCIRTHEIERVPIRRGRGRWATDISVR